MSATAKQQKFSAEDKRALLKAGEAAWSAAPRSRNVTFDWQGSRYRLRPSNLRFRVETINGVLVVWKYHF
jgi:hypothetical protein